MLGFRLRGFGLRRFGCFSLGLRGLFGSLGLPGIAFGRVSLDCFRFGFGLGRLFRYRLLAPGLGRGFFDFTLRVFIDFDELAAGFERCRALAAFETGIGHRGGIQLDGSDRVVVAGNDVLDAVRVRIRVDHADHGNLHAVRFGDGDALMIDVDHEQGIRQSAHFLDSADTALKLLSRPHQHQRFLLGHALEGAVLFLLLEFLEPADRTPDGLVVGEHAAKPAMVDIGHLATLRFPLNDPRGGALGADEQDLLAPGGELGNLLQRVVERRQRGFEIDDVDLVAGAEDVRLHLGIPVTALVAEMHARAQHFFHTYGHI